MIQRKHLALAVAAAALAAGCGPSGVHLSGVVAEGVLFSVEWELGDGSSKEFSRVDGDGRDSWNDAYGKLTSDFLVITRPGRPEFGPEIIPVSRLIAVQFGDGGFKKVGKKN